MPEPTWRLLLDVDYRLRAARLNLDFARERFTHSPGANIDLVNQAQAAIDALLEERLSLREPAGT